jgi:DMSO/TMAO reductase YedYZ molybdopterin-dependent catalytic subunit
MTFNKLFEEKIKKAQSNNKLIGKESRTRLPSGQTLTEKFPVLDLGITPEVSLNEWTLKIFGEVTHELEFDYESLKSEFDIVEDVSDFHCVTHWSKFDLKWKGFRPRDLLKWAYYSIELF